MISPQQYRGRGDGTETAAVTPFDLRVTERKAARKAELIVYGAASAIASGSAVMAGVGFIGILTQPLPIFYGSMTGLFAAVAIFCAKATLQSHRDLMRKMSRDIDVNVARLDESNRLRNRVLLLAARLSALSSGASGEARDGDMGVTSAPSLATIHRFNPKAGR